MDAHSENRDFRRYSDEGSSEALARVFDAVAPRLLLLAAHLTPDPAQAEDLVQTTFLQGMRDAARYDGKRPIGAWLAGILNHRALDLRRRSALRAHQPLLDEHSTELDPAELAADQELIERVIAEINHMPPTYREVVSLRVVHGLCTTSIAHTLGRPPGTVRMQLKRGLERLRSAMPERSAFLSVFLLESGRGLDVVKEVVLAEADACAVAAASSGSQLLGGVTIMKLVAVAIVALAIAVIPQLVSENEVARASAVAQIDQELPTELFSSAEQAKPKEAQRPTAELPREPVAVNNAPEAPTVTRGSIAVRVRYASDGAPAADVGVYIRANEGGGLGLEGRTNSLGLVDFHGLAEGRHSLHLDRVQDAIPFEAPLAEPLDVVIPDGVRVRGRVLDLEGKPVKNASIMRLNQEHHDVLQVAAKADANGRFEFRDVADGTEFLARVEGFQPSELETVREGDGAVAELELVMGAHGHRVTGQVLDADGKPVPRAWIAIGVDEDARNELRGSDAQPILEERRKAMDLEALLLRADEDGRFESREVPAGYALVMARPVEPDSDQIGCESLWVRYGTEEQVTIRLQRNAVVHGVLKDSDGRPLAGLELEAQWEGTPALGQMEDDLGPLMSDRRCLSGEDGSFRLPGLLPGDYDLAVLGQRKKLLKLERMITAGEIVQWNPVIEPQAELTLRLLDAEGQPLSGWIVSLSDSGAPALVLSFLTKTTDSEGRRSLMELKRGVPYQVTIYAPNARGRFSMLPAATRSEVVAGESEVVLQLTNDETKLGSISGLWLNEAGQPQPDRFLGLSRVDGTGNTGVISAEDGSYSFEAVPAGEYQFSAGQYAQVIETVTLAPGEDHRDLTIRSAQAGN